MNELIIDDSILGCLNWATQYFEEHEIPNARHDAEEILGFVSGKSRVEIYLDGSDVMDKSPHDTFLSLIKKRSQGYPLQYLLGNADFFGLNFAITEDVLIPRPETEVLVETVIKIVKLLNCKIVRLLDIGTGSGNIAVSLASLNLHLKIVATDISCKALGVAKKNSEINGVQAKVDFVLSDLFDALKEGKDLFDLIVSNPPYIPDSQLENLQPEVRYEPRLVLDGKEDGLFYIKKIIEDSPQYLKKDGILVMEIGFGQAKAVRDIFSRSAFSKIEFVSDYQGIDRVAVLNL